jgi:ATP-dependent exoDNAse (exonuclease V) beta subunit
MLSACLKADERSDEWRDPPTNRLLRPVWETFRQQMEVPGELADETTADVNDRHRLWRLGDPPPTSRVTGIAQSAGAGSNIPERAHNRLERHVGTVVHQALEELSQRNVLPREPGDADLARWSMGLRRLGLSGDSLAEGRSLLQQALQTTLEDRRGRWVLSSGHRFARSEYALTLPAARDRFTDLVIDRTFVDDDTGERWIVDYKTSRPAAGETQEEFLRRESSKYRGQLQAYREAMAACGPEPVRCALYFTGLGVLHEIRFERTES